MTNEIKIDDNIVQERSYSRRGATSPITKALIALKVGQSFFNPDNGTAANQSNLSSRARIQAKIMNDGRKYSTSKVTENGIKGVRIWRVK